MRHSPFMIVLGLIITFGATIAAAATGEVFGTVRDAETGKLLPGANVLLEGTAIGAASSMEGEYRLPRVPEASLVVYDLLGREVVRLVDGTIQQGAHEVMWNSRAADGREVPTGVYIARLVTPDFSKSIKMVLLK